MPEAGGVLPGQEVTVLGQAVGVVEDVEIVPAGVALTLRIRADERVPADPAVTVLRRSPIGEQAVDLAPPGPAWVAAEADATLEPTARHVPAAVPFLLEQTADLFRAIDPDDLSTLVGELAIALDGRGQTLKDLNADSLELNRTFVDAIPEFERMIDSSSVVLETLADHRDDLADSITNAADLTELFAAERGRIEQLLEHGTPMLTEADTFVRTERANLSCLIGDLQALNDMMNGPSTWDGAEAGRYASKLDEFEQLLRLNRYFFDQGFWIITQPDPTTGGLWQRINFTSDEAGGQPYPERRATPATRPGAACTTDAWGVGVNAVRQDDPRDHDPTSPGVDYAPLVDDASRTEADGSRGDDTPAVAARDDDATVLARAAGAELPATGGGALAVAPLLLALALWLRRTP
jgi:virulence factor Mce-like protein